MQCAKYSAFSIFIFALFMTSCQKSKPAQIQAPKSLNDYRVIQFISASGYSPTQIMALDNNGAILYTCRSRKTREELQGMGIKTTESQLRLLDLYDLLNEKDNVLKTAIPILQPDQIGRIRRSSLALAEKIVPLIKPEVLQLVADLGGIGREKNTYSILFSYILDGKAWDAFEARGLMHPVAIDAQHPFWSGEVWALYPDRSYFCGTNSWKAGKYVFYENWNSVSMPRLSPFHQAIKRIDDATFIHVIDKGVIDDPSWRETFAPFGIADEDGRLTLPIFSENRDNTIYAHSQAIINEIADNIVKLISFENLKDEYDFRDAQQAFVVYYHELMWDIMAILEKDQVVTKPAVFTEDRSVTSKELGDLMFIVKQ